VLVLGRSYQNYIYSTNLCQSLFSQLQHNFICKVVVRWVRFRF